MNKPTSAEIYALPRWMRGWERFWFTPEDPIVLALIRIAASVLVFYTLLNYSFNLQETMGEFAWQNLKLRLDTVRDQPVVIAPLTGIMTAPLPAPADPFQAEYKLAYERTFGITPPPPYPVSMEQVQYLYEFRKKHNVDLRLYGLRPPITEAERAYIENYMLGWQQVPFAHPIPPPPPAYPSSVEEERVIDDYRFAHGIDPRILYDRGVYAFSLWFSVTDPLAMAVLNGLFVLASFLMLIGFATRFTSAITWFASLCYIHRNPTVLFGADTMMNLLLLYLMIGPSGAALSVDSWLRRWWSRRHGQAAAPGVAPSVSANVALRLLQVNLCFIYLFAGLSKLLGVSWWNGTAVWGVIACYEFAPMRSPYYLEFLRWIAGNQLIFSIIVTGGGLFTLAFEISFAFLVWRPNLRWIFLGSAIILHGFIGLFMGLTTFTLLMVVLNMAFLRKEEAYWVLRLFGYRKA